MSGDHKGETAGVSGVFRDTGLPSFFLGALGFYVLWLTIQGFVVPGWWEPESPRANWGGELAQLGLYVSLALAAGVQFLRRHRPLSLLWAPEAGESLQAWSWFFGLTLGGLVATIVIAVADDGVRAAWFPHLRDVSPDLDFGSPLNWLVVVIGAPIVEELVFRGYLLHRWARRWGPSFALVATSVLFALLHPNPIGHFFGAVILGLVAVKTGSLLAPVGIHLGNNLIAMLIGVAARGLEPEAADEALTGTELGAAVVLALGTMGFLVWGFARYWPRKTAGRCGPRFLREISL